MVNDLWPWAVVRGRDVGGSGGAALSPDFRPELRQGIPAKPPASCSAPFHSRACLRVLRLVPLSFAPLSFAMHACPAPFGPCLSFCAIRSVRACLMYGVG